MYTITDGKIVKTSTTLDRAEQIAKQLTTMFNTRFTVQHHKDVWNVNSDK